ncbi:MAG TPA: alpha/beta fold hydrolase [Candidatus Polarisedimenticolia bacterium]|nr:alpha/beta fold hydrolase [Candidatus Polarisedimenticolia bacterium]
MSVVRLSILLAAACLTAAAAPAIKAPAPEKGEMLEIAPGLSIFYEVKGQGSGTPLFVVNGGPGFDHAYLHCSDAWDRLAAGRRVVFYDQRGNGRSTPLKDDQTTKLLDQIADLDALRTHLGAQKFDLLGHSWGGYLVMAYAARHPERIQHLVIADSAAPRIQETAFLFKHIYPETTERQHALAFAEALGDPEAIARSLREYSSMLFVSNEVRDAYLLRSDSFVFRPKINQALWGEAERYDLNPELLKYRFPTLVATGRYDFNVAPSVAYAIHQKVPGSEFAVFEKSGHLPFCEESDAWVKRIEAFLRGK